MILSWYGDPNDNWDSLPALHKSPRASEVACPHVLVRVHLEGVVVPAQKPNEYISTEDNAHQCEHDVAMIVATNIPSTEDTTDPRKHDVAMIVTMDCCQCDKAIYRVLHYHQAKGSTAQCPGKPQVGLQKYGRVGKALLFHLVCLHTQLLHEHRQLHLPDIYTHNCFMSTDSSTYHTFAHTIASWAQTAAPTRHLHTQLDTQLEVKHKFRLLDVGWLPGDYKLELCLKLRP
jgi:hypothetical protein